PLVPQMQVAGIPINVFSFEGLQKAAIQFIKKVEDAYNGAKGVGKDAYGGYYKRKKYRKEEYRKKITNPMTKAGLPNKGRFRFIPGKEVKFNKQHKGYFYKFGNLWKEGPYHGDPKKNFEFEWDVQLSEKGIKEWGKYAKNGKNMSMLHLMEQFHTNVLGGELCSNLAYL
ncbi:polymorphic toxin type 17 domain-containing protein, partial [Bacillus sp. CLL-7-23]